MTTDRKADMAAHFAALDRIITANFQRRIDAADLTNQPTNPPKEQK
jgi:hypothetical protein